MPKVIEGNVIHGKNLGKKIGFPTANINIDHGVLSPATYKINILLENKNKLTGYDQYEGVGVYMGENIFEAHIFNFHNNIYGQKIKIYILEKLRENQKFHNSEALSTQIKKDIKMAKSTKNYVITFGSFDVIHPGHEYYLKSAKAYGDTLITIVGHEKNIKNIKGKPPLYSNVQRLEHVKSLHIADIVHLGDENFPLKWIKTYKPSVICLGYDQAGFAEGLDSYIQENTLNTVVIRINSYKSNEYHSSLIKEK